MHIYFTAISIIAGICLGFGVLFLFIGLRRKDNKPLNLTFALFALCYAVTLFNGIRWYSSSTPAEYIAANRFDAVFITTAFVSLVWYFAQYTAVKPRLFLWVLSGALIVPGVVYIFNPAAFTGEVNGLTFINLPWGETLADMDASGSIWLDILLFARLAALGYIIFALFIQYRRGERQAAVILGVGMLPFIIGIFYEILGESGFVPYIPFGELGFLGIAIAATIQMSNSVIKTEEALAEHQHNLKAQVEERTAELKTAQESLVLQVQDAAVSAERSRLARDLHDAVTQTIYSASLIAEVLPQVWARDKQEGERDLVKLRQLVRGALAEMRILLFELRPTSLEAANFETLLHQLGDTLTARSRIPVEISVEQDLEIPADVKIVFYRVTQEAFNNIIKHSEASHASVKVNTEEDRVMLQIQDNGRGFQPGDVIDETMGIQFMRERLESINAGLEIKSSPGGGTILTAAWEKA